MVAMTEERWRTLSDWLGQALEKPVLERADWLEALKAGASGRWPILLDAGVLEDSQPYLILEYVEGEAIDAYCNRHALGIQERIRLFLSVLHAVAHAHSNLIVHRDLKPSNVFVAHTARSNFSTLVSPSSWTAIRLRPR
jgi:serine/threonine protein kinase